MLLRYSDLINQIAQTIRVGAISDQEMGTGVCQKKPGRKRRVKGLPQLNDFLELGISWSSCCGGAARSGS